MSNHNKPIPLGAVPLVGQAQPPIDVTQASVRVCACGSNVFDQAFTLGMVSRMASGNKTGQDVLVQMPVFVCRECGTVFKL